MEGVDSGGQGGDRVEEDGIVKFKVEEVATGLSKVMGLATTSGAMAWRDSRAGKRRKEAKEDNEERPPLVKFEMKEVGPPKGGKG